MILSIRYGLFAGFATIIYLLIFYFTNKNLLVNPYIVWATMIFYVAAMYAAANVVSTDDFKDYLKAAFVAFLVANLLYYNFYYILFGAIDTQLLELQQQQAIIQAKLLAQQANTPQLQQQWQAAINDLEQNGAKLSYFQIVQSMAQGAVGGFLLSALVALGVMQKNK